MMLKFLGKGEKKLRDDGQTYLHIYII